MRLTLDRDLFAAASPDEAIALLGLLTAVANEPHCCTLLTNPTYVPGGDNGPLDTWLARRPQHEADAFVPLFANGLILNSGPLTPGATDAESPRRWHLEGSLSIRVERRQNSDWRSRVLTLADAVDLLREPIHLVLDDDRTDLAFLRFLAGSTDGEFLRIQLAKPGRIAVHGGGGGASRMWIQALTAVPLTAVSWRRLLRTWLLFDRDASDSNALEMSSSAAALMALCEEVISLYGGGLSWVCLRRREIESYVPDRALRDEMLAQHQTFVERVISWRADPARTPWAWALSLKKGLAKDLRADVSKEERTAIKERTKALEAQLLKDPFDQLPAADVSTLAHGLADRLGEAIRAQPDRPWTSEIPIEYDRGPTDQAPRQELVRSLFDRM